MRKFISLFILTLLFIGKSHGQSHVLAFGIQYKPIIPTNIFGAGRIDVTSESGQFNTVVKQKFGHVFGGVVRIGLTRMFSLETGINYVMRNYSTDFSVADSNVYANNDFRVISYQIPLSFLVYIKLSKMFHMNVAIGSSMAFFPSNIATITDSEVNTKIIFETQGLRRSWFQGTFDANVGFELRTEKHGYFYLGASYQIPFTRIMDLAFEYSHSGDKQEVTFAKLNGAYLTADIRYFFAEDPGKKKKWEAQKEKYNQEQNRRKAIRKAKKDAKNKRKGKVL